MPTPVIRTADRPGDLGWIVQAHGELYSAEYGYDTAFEALVAGIVADFGTHHDADREAGWIAELDGRRVGCVLCVRGDDDTTAKLRVLLVDAAARGHRIGTRLVDECLRFARDAGYRRMTLWTHDSLAAARRIYLARGFRLVDSTPERSFGVDVVSQNYDLDLCSAPEPSPPRRAR